ncbi:MAG: DUF4114 domain-containing protein, partial [Leptolyngbya sp. SIO3F4]|nr:DUF4114 domain-containing protein [Leptolyngbya sp. SIO3F4]
HDLVTTNRPELHIDIFSSDAELVKLSFLQEFFNILTNNPTPGGKDRFVLGDTRTSYYAKNGYKDFAFIFDYKINEDVIQLKGSPEDYQVVSLPLLGTGIFERQSGSQTVWQDDLVGIVFWNFDLDLNGPGFTYTSESDVQNPVESKILNFGTIGVDWSSSITLDDSDNVIVSGFTNGDLDGPNKGSYDAWIRKYDRQGELVWTKQFGTPRYEQLVAVKTDSQDNIYVVGSTQGELGGNQQAQEGDAWLGKFDANGNQLWVKQFGSDLLTASTGLEIDPLGNVLVSGITGKLDPRPDTDVNKVIDFQDDFFIIKYDSDGNQAWATEVQSPLNSIALWDEVYGIATAPDGSIYATGWTYGDHTGQGGFAYYTSYVYKFSASGNVEWFRQFGTPGWDFGKDIALDSHGNIYAFGWTDGNLKAGSLSPDPTVGIPELPHQDPPEDLWLVKYSQDGEQIWLHQFGTSEDDGAMLGGIAIDSRDRIYLTGYTNGDLGGPNRGGYDAWAAAFDVDGNQLWKQQFGTPGLDYGTDIAVNNSGNIFVTGLTEGSFNAVNAGAIDSWIAKLDANTGSLLNFQEPTLAPNNLEQNPPNDNNSIPSLINLIVSDIDPQHQNAVIETIDLQGMDNVTLSFEVYREAAYDNLVGFYAIENNQGQVRDALGVLLSPGDPGYSQAALENRTDVSLETQNNQTSAYTTTFNQGQLWAPFLISNGTLEALLDDNHFNDPEIYFSHAGANSNGFDHVRLLDSNTLGFEDLKAGGDQDFNDMVIKISIT